MIAVVVLNFIKILIKTFFFIFSYGNVSHKHVFFQKVFPIPKFGLLFLSIFQKPKHFWLFLFHFSLSYFLNILRSLSSFMGK